ncbi:nose resistant to fluoxetine protein 6 [Ixodes scapularis]
MGFSGWWVSLALLLAATPYTLRSSEAQDEESFTRNYEEDMNEILKVAVQKFLPLISDVITRPEVSGDCSSALLKTFRGLQQRKAWALRMAMSNALFAPNALEGTYVNMGGYEQCLRARVRSSSGELYFKGQYCSLFFALPKDYYTKIIESFHEIGELQGRLNPLAATSAERYQNVDIRGAICIPSLCSSEDINFVLRSVLYLYGANATAASCRTDDPKEISSLQAVSIAVLSTLFILVVIATLLEWILERHCPSESRTHGIPMQILLYFSAITNTRFLLNTDIKPENEPLRFISGFKVIMAFWVVYGHAHILVQTGFFHALYRWADISEDVSFQFIPNAFLSVTSFFFMSGFVVSYIATKSREQILRNNMLLVYIGRVVRRYIRITVPAAILIFAAFILPLLGSGPADEDTYMQMINGCIRNWWTVLVHTNNFNPDGEICLQHLWYVSADLQIFVFIAFPLGLMLLKFPKSACFAAVVVAIAFNGLISFQVYSHNLFYAFTSGTNDVAKLARTMKYTYLRPFSHVSSYLTGILCGYVSVQHKNVSVRPILQAAFWVTSFGLACFVMFVTYDWNKGHLPGVVTSALYGGFHRNLWSLVYFWPFYACATGRGGLFNKFFGWAFFFPFSRLTFSIYLVHFLLFLLRQMRLRTYLNADEYFQFITILGVFSLSLFFAYLLYLTVEAPLLRLEKLIFERPSNLKSETNGKLVLEVRSEKSQL